jgi:hypothetical protein
LLDREPLNQIERELVNGFPQVADLDAIWVREVPPAISGGYPIYRVYLAFAVMRPEAREMADRIMEAFETRHHFDKIEFEFHHIPHDRIPKDVPARIWHRPPRIWTPGEIVRKR